jgi:hypothetical protein
MDSDGDLQDAVLGEPDDGTALADQALPAASLLAAEAEVFADANRPADADVLVISEEEVISWPAVRPGLDLKPGQLALYAGWTMAVLYGSLTGPPIGPPAKLASVNELAPEHRRKLELARLRHLLTGLGPDFADLATRSWIPAGDGDEELRERLAKLDSLNLGILTALTARQPKLQLAYELGRSLRDTANPPGGDDTAVATQLERRRVAKLQEWLVALSPEFPPLTAAVVAGSLGRWSDFAAVTAGTSRAPTAESMCKYLLPQGDVWLMLLIGELATSGLLTPEGYVSAGEAALRRSGAMVRGILRHYWFGMVCVAAALGVTLFLAARYLEGASKVWTSIACIAGGLGVSVQTIASTSARLAAEAEKPVFTMAEDDAMAWAITTLPPVSLTGRDVRQLRRAGVAATASLSRF